MIRKHTLELLLKSAPITSVRIAYRSSQTEGKLLTQVAVTLGPNCPIGNGPVLISIEAEVEYIIQMLSKFQKENFDSFQVKAESVQEFNVWKDEFMKHTSKQTPLTLRRFHHC